MTVAHPGSLWGPLRDALAGGSCVAPASDAATLAMLRPELPVAEPDAALIVATSGSPAAIPSAPGDVLIALPEAGPVSGSTRVPDLATAMRRYPTPARIRVVGE